MCGGKPVVGRHVDTPNIKTAANKSKIAIIMNINKPRLLISLLLSNHTISGAKVQSTIRGTVTVFFRKLIILLVRLIENLIEK